MQKHSSKQFSCLIRNPQKVILSLQIIANHDIKDFPTSNLRLQWGETQNAGGIWGSIWTQLKKWYQASRCKWCVIEKLVSSYIFRIKKNPNAKKLFLVVLIFFCVWDIWKELTGCCRRRFLLENRSRRIRHRFWYGWKVCQRVGISPFGPYETTALECRGEEFFRQRVLHHVLAKRTG